jgi:hypothetical protein
MILINLFFICFSINTCYGKAFQNDPDILPGQPEWSQWQLTTTLPMKNIENNNKLENIYYYYNGYGVSNCAEPNSGIPCTSEMHFVGLPNFNYIPYNVWYTFSSHKISNKTIWLVKLWFNFNNTNTVLIDSNVCDGKFQSSLPIYPFYLNFSLTFKYRCNIKNELMNFELYQKTRVNGVDSSDIKLAWFKYWKPYTSIVNYEYDLQPIITVQKQPPLFTPCKFCENK